MEIKVLYDKSSSRDDIKTGWGLSLFIGGKTLFDTGENGGWLLENMEISGMNVSKDVENIVISHDHWDHTGGLRDVLLLLKGRVVPVYVCPGLSGETRKMIECMGCRLVEAFGCMRVSENIFTTGELPGSYKGLPMPEQAVVIRTGNGISVVTGCAHPGILNMLDRVKGMFKKEKIFMVAGGFHLKDAGMETIEHVSAKFLEIGVEKAGPTHCSGDKAERVFIRSYGDNFIRVRAGDSIIV
jgi:7,8-dihydropterin-6-yl-methyl-4-(beta-D-ribofuranosyl)aminobenzene 5'-phosphate synthase